MALRPTTIKPLRVYDHISGYEYEFENNDDGYARCTKKTKISPENKSPDAIEFMGSSVVGESFYEDHEYLHQTPHQEMPDDDFDPGEEFILATKQP